MNCDEFPWVGFLENLLSARERRSAELHLAECSACAAARPRWELLIAESACVAPWARINCPDAETLVTALLPGADPELLQHVGQCRSCMEELEGVRDLEAEVRAMPQPLPEELLSQVAIGSEEKGRSLGKAVMSLVNEHLGHAPAAVGRWRRAVADLVADMGQVPKMAGAFAAPEPEAGEKCGSGPVELKVHTEGIDVEVVFSGPWMRSKAMRHGAPVAGVTIRLENVLGEIAETETDGHGEAAIREDLPGLRRIVIAVDARSGK